MTIQDVIYGAWGSSAAVSIMGAFLVFFVRRSLAKYDKHIENQYRKIGEINRDQLKKYDEIKDSINELKVNLGIVNTQIVGLGRLIDNINRKGCRSCREKNHTED